ncbi:putative nuclease HARBI1 [Dermacentor andersoni]|uniref:putative nuclease HARBI1 n=1 Tax=Dermacentor andersoni TaxID=34620 RepID=UPI0021550AA7|nr:putative nuclease HARBI1 [Dermacentor andersoni]
MARTQTNYARRNIIFALLVRRLRRKKNRSLYIRDIFDKRPECGEYHHLVQELRNSDPEYHFKYFRLTKASFDKLLSLVHRRLVHPPTHRRAISPAERLAVTLRFLATGGSMEDIALSYRMHASTVASVLKETLPAIWDCLKPLVLGRPSTQRWRDIAEEYYDKWDFPNTIGSIDGKHFAIKCPNKSGSDFYNYKGFYSLIMLAIADANYRFIMVDIGAQGRYSDASFFKRSPLQAVFEEGALGLPSNMSKWPPCLVGDAAFPLRTYLVPYPGRKLDDRKKVFNYRLSRARRCIENAFGILVSRWRVFFGTVEGAPELLNNMIQAAVCLHNSLMGDAAYCPDEYSGTLCGETVYDGEWRRTVTKIGTKTVPSNNRPTSAAMAMRDELADYFMSAECSLPWQLMVVRRC